MSHGLAAVIRSSVESATFDLAGQNVTTIENAIRDAFNEPMELNEMIRLTFVTGAGKLGRARYDDNAAKAVTSCLRELGYEEDRGASAVMECAGSFKLQHDTGKNLKTVVVFPKVIDKKSQKSESGILSMAGASVLGDIDHKLAHTPINLFPRMIELQCETWSQKKACASALLDLKEIIEKLDESLSKGQKALSEAEQNLYNSLSITSLEERISCVRELLHKQVDDGAITNMEKQTLLKQIVAKLQDIQKSITDAEKENQSKRVQNLKVAENKARERKAKLDAIVARPLPKLKNESEIHKLRAELVPLLDIEEAAKGRLLTLKESQSVARKDDILKQIQELELSSRGWFETDESFEARVKASLESWKAKTQQSKKKSSAAAPGAAVGATKATKTTQRNPTTVWSKPVTKAPAKSSGGLFAAMMQDSDSD